MTAQKRVLDEQYSYLYVQPREFLNLIQIGRDVITLVDALVHVIRADQMGRVVIERDQNCNTGKRNDWIMRFEGRPRD